MTAAALDLPIADRPDDATVLDEPEQTARFTRWERRGGESEGTRTAVSALLLQGTWCAACGGPIERALREVDGVLEATVDARALRASVRWDPSRTRPSALVQAVRRAGYDALPDTAVDARALRRRESRQALWRLFVAGFCAMQVMMLATPVYVAGPDGMAGDLRRLLDWGSWVLTLPVMLFSAAPFFRGSWAALRARRIGMDVPVALGIAVAFAASSVAAFDPRGPLGDAVYFDSLTMFVALLLGARWLELRARHRAAAALEDALGALPETAERLAEDGRSEWVSPARLRAGDRVRVAAGQGFPADGRVLEGRSAADEALLSGESRPCRKRPGDEVVAGSVNLEAPLVLRVERTGADTRYEAIVALMREAQTRRPDAARWADRWAAPFLWGVLLLAAAAAAAWSLVDPARAVWVAVSVLIVTCPCALSLATPSALLAAADGLARRGVLLRRLEALETLAHCERLFIDKTGTLTEDRPRFVGAALQAADVGGEPAGQAGAGALLELAAALAAWSRHPLARALAAARPEAAQRSARWRAVEERPGCGLQAEDAAGRRWRLGRAAWVADDDRREPRADAAAGLREPRADVAAVELGEPRADDADADADPELDTWFGPVGRPLLRLRFEEALREGAAPALAALRADGLPATLLSGDAPRRVARLAAALPLDGAVGGASPADKLQAVRRAQAAGAPVAMLGDGINDAPVLAQADVSLAMGSGALLARSQADAVLLADGLSALPALRRTARRCLRVIRQNLAWAAAYNLLCVPLALAGLLPPWAAGLGMAASSLLVCANALRLRR